MALIYKITNQVNQKVYIGKSAYTIDKRWREHIKDSKKQTLEKRPLYEAFNKYGIENFHIELIEDGLNDEEACIQERYWIKFYNSYIGFENSNGYNATLGGDSRRRYDYKVIADKYLELGTVKDVVQFFNCDPKTVRVACKENNILIKQHGGKAVHCIETNDIFNSISEAGRVLDPNNANAVRANISRAIHKNGSAYGLHWEFIYD